MNRSKDAAPSGLVIAFFIAAIQLVLHVATNGNYGVFRDELYYLDCARHLGWGYVDQPPLSIWLLALATKLFGESVHAIRLLSELAGAGLVVVSALIAKEMRGGRLAQILAALTVAVAPGPLALSGFFSMNAFDLLFWALLAWLLVKIVNTNNPKLWLWFGAVAGLGLFNKISVLFLGFGVAVAIVMTPLRRHLGHWQLWAGGALSGLIFLPYLIWNQLNQWPMLEFMENAKRHKIAVMSPLDFFGEQVLAMSPPLAPLWLGGLVWLLLPRSKSRGGEYRALGWAFLTVAILLVNLKVKPYYLFAGVVLLFPAGGCAMEGLLGKLGNLRGRKWATGTLVVWVIAAGLLTIPGAIPVLSPDHFLKYQATLGIGPKHYETNAVGAMPQYFSDRFGWENMTEVVASVYRALPEQERSTALIVGGNYGEAGAINYYGPRLDLGLPNAVSGHNSHYLWGPGTDQEPAAVIQIGGRKENLEQTFEEVTHAATVTSTYGMPYESNLPIWVCRRMKVSVDEAWQAGKNFS